MRRPLRSVAPRPTASELAVLLSLQSDSMPFSSHSSAMQDLASSASGPVRIDGFEEDIALSKSEFLTRGEVLKRRIRRLKQLSRIYRDHYWALMDELKVKYREYYWEYGKSPYFVDEEQEKDNSHHVAATENAGNGNCFVGSANGAAAGRCGMHGCKAKAMALTKFCQIHILSEAGQKLYKPCSFSIKSTNTGPIPCGKPILKSTVPSFCPLHFQKSEKHMLRALKKGGLNIASTSKLAPKCNVLLSEYVRLIQLKRRAAIRASLEYVEVGV